MTEEMLCPLVYADQVLLKEVIGQPLPPPFTKGEAVVFSASPPFRKEGGTEAFQQLPLP